MRGGERVLLSLARLFPGAPIFTLLHVPGTVASELEQREIHTSFLQRLPGTARHYRYYLPLFPRAAASLDVSGFDLVVSSSHCAAKAVATRADALHLCYCHTPMRYVWDRYDDYFGPGRAPLPTRLLMRLLAPRLRAWDVATAAGVDQFVANSRYVAGRIRRYYRREAEVIHPPVDTDFFTPPRSGAARSYDLIVSALAPYKRIELVLDCYRGSGRPVKIVGTGPEATRLQALAPPEVSFLGYRSDEELRGLYQQARVVIMPGVEDFGIVPLEAMACGVPAIVFAEGGGAESVVPGETGFVFEEATVSSLRAAVDALAGLRLNTGALRARAERYSRDQFERRFAAFVERATVSRRGDPATTQPC
jgi:glycosyltransferase involved in cell wall biosynthesis